eukprot:403373625
MKVQNIGFLHLVIITLLNVINITSCSQQSHNSIGTIQFNILALHTIENRSDPFNQRRFLEEEFSSNQVNQTTDLYKDGAQTLIDDIRLNKITKQSDLSNPENTTASSTDNDTNTQDDLIKQQNNNITDTSSNNNEEQETPVAPITNSTDTFTNSNETNNTENPNSEENNNTTDSINWDLTDLLSGFNSENLLSESDFFIILLNALNITDLLEQSKQTILVQLNSALSMQGGQDMVDNEAFDQSLLMIRQYLMTVDQAYMFVYQNKMFQNTDLANDTEIKEIVMKADITDYNSLKGYDNGKVSSNNEKNDDQMSAGRKFVVIGLPIIFIIVAIIGVVTCIFVFCLKRKTLDNGQEIYVWRKSLKKGTCLKLKRNKKVKKVNESYSNIDDTANQSQNQLIYSSNAQQQHIPIDITLQQNQGLLQLDISQQNINDFIMTPSAKAGFDKQHLFMKNELNQQVQLQNYVDSEASNDKESHKIINLNSQKSRKSNKNNNNSITHSQTNILQDDNTQSQPNYYQSKQSQSSFLPPISKRDHSSHNTKQAVDDSSESQIEIDLEANQNHQNIYADPQEELVEDTVSQKSRNSKFNKRNSSKKQHTSQLNNVIGNEINDQDQGNQQTPIREENLYLKTQNDKEEDQQPINQSMIDKLYVRQENQDDSRNFNEEQSDAGQDDDIEIVEQYQKKRSEFHQQNSRKLNNDSDDDFYEPGEIAQRF